MSEPTPKVAPESLRNLGDVVCAWDPGSDRVAVIDSAGGRQRRISYRKLAAMAGAVGPALAMCGARPGSRVGLLGRNSVEYLAAYFGVMQAGYTVVPLNRKLPADTLDAIAADAGLFCALVDGDVADKLPVALTTLQLNDPAGPLFSAEIDGAGSTSADGLPAEPVPGAGLHADPGVDAELLYTSGSTGVPKGVELPHAGQIWGLATLCRNVPPGRHTHIVAQPLFHMNGIVVSSLALLTGGTIVLQPGFAPADYVAAIAEHRVDFVSAIPTMWARALTLAEAGVADLSSVTSLSLGSAPVTGELLSRTRAVLPNVDIAISYGTTEAGPAVFGPHPGGIPRPDRALGYPVPGIDVRLVGGSSPDEGVLQMRTPATMRGYRGQSERTAEVVLDGWYHSGDVMRRDGNGFYYFIGRADDMFVCSGENIYPGEVERVLESHPAVRQAAVVPLPDDERGQMPVAFVVTAPGASLTAAELQRHALAHAAPHLHPRRVAVRPELPLAGTNKVDRAALRVEAARLEAEGGWDA